MIDTTRVRRDWSERALGTGARWRTLILVAVIVLGQSGTALASSWYADYQAGVDAIEVRQWDRAAEDLEAALAKKGREDQSRSRIRWYGVVRRPYIAEFFLAVAYHNLNRSAEAVALLENVQRDGLVVEGDDEFDRFTTVLADARRQVAIRRATASAGR